MMRAADSRAASWILGSSVVCTMRSTLGATPPLVAMRTASSAAVSK